MKRSNLAPFARLASSIAAASLAVVAVAACGGKMDDGGTNAAARPIATAAGSRADTRPAQLAQAEDPALPPPQGEICPERMPSFEDWCPKPYARCTYVDTCSQRPPGDDTAIFECTGSRWTRLGGEYEVKCPAAPPVSGSSCEVGCKYPRPCAYATPCGALSATCEPRSGTWFVSGTSCASDGGAADDGG